MQRTLFANSRDFLGVTVETFGPFIRNYIGRSFMALSYPQTAGLSTPEMSNFAVSRFFTKKPYSEGENWCRNSAGPLLPRMVASGATGIGKIWKKLQKSMKDSMQNPTLMILNLHIRNKAVRVQRTYAIENADFVCRGNTTVNLHRII